MSWQILAAEASVGQLGVGDHPQFAAGLNGESLLDAFEAGGDRFQFLHPFDVAFEGFAAGAGTRGAAGVGGRDQHRVRMIDANIVVVPQRGVDHLGTLAVALQQFGADFGVAAFGLVVGRLADVVQQPAAAGQARRRAPSPRPSCR